MQRAERRNVRRMVNNGEIKGGKSRKELRRKRGGKKVPIHGDTQHDRGNTAGRKEGLATCFCTCDDGEFFFLSLSFSHFFRFLFFKGHARIFLLPISFPQYTLLCSSVHGMAYFRLNRRRRLEFSVSPSSADQAEPPCWRIRVIYIILLLTPFPAHPKAIRSL